jgi:hypothetical protein
MTGPLSEASLGRGGLSAAPSWATVPVPPLPTLHDAIATDTLATIAPATVKNRARTTVRSMSHILARKSFECEIGYRMATRLLPGFRRGCYSPVHPRAVPGRQGDCEREETKASRMRHPARR